MVIAVEIQWVPVNDSSIEERHSTPETAVSADGGKHWGGKNREKWCQQHLFGMCPICHQRTNSASEGGISPFPNFRTHHTPS
jgi:hypothetical protein